MTVPRRLAMLVRAVVIRNNRALGFVVLAMGAAQAAISILTRFWGLSSIAHLCFEGVFAVALFACGLGMLRRPLGELTATELTVRSMYGFHLRYPADQLRIVGDRMYCGERHILSGWNANRDDWQSLVDHMQARGA